VERGTYIKSNSVKQLKHTFVKSICFLNKAKVKKERGIFRESNCQYIFHEFPVTWVYLTYKIIFFSLEQRESTVWDTPPSWKRKHAHQRIRPSVHQSRVTIMLVSVISMDTIRSFNFEWRYVNKWLHIKHNHNIMSTKFLRANRNM
jgi:hypothetical protein